MKLILSGGGIGDKCHESYKLFSKLVKNKKVLFVPFANDEMSYQEALEWFKGEINGFGIKQVDMIESPNDLTLEKLNSYGGVYVSGGNTFKLLSELKQSNAFINLMKFCETECVIMGASAGATLFGKSIDTCLRNELKIIASDSNYIELKETDGLNKAFGFSLFVHYRVKESQYDATEIRVNQLLRDGHDLICIPEESSVFINDDVIKVIGDMPVEVITQNYRKSFSSNCKVDVLSFAKESE